jgi:hypothetical protein
MNAALAFAARGFAVFPVNWPVVHNGKNVCSCGSDGRWATVHQPGKAPLREIVSQRSALGHHRDRHRQDVVRLPGALRHLGVRCDGLIVVDIDPRHGGDESLAALERAVVR